MSPHHTHPMIPASNRSSSVNRHSSSSPTANGSPPPTVTPSALLANSSSGHESQRLLKIRRFLGALVQFGQDTSADVGDRLRSLVLSLAVSKFKFYFIEYVFKSVFNSIRAAVYQLKNFKLPFKKQQTFHFDQMYCHSFAQISHFCSVK
jgi:hypothetical protein